MSGIQRGAWFLAYNILFSAGALLSSPYFLLKMVRTGKYRKGIGQRFAIYRGLFKSLREERPIWVHAVSVGEVNAAAPLIKELKRRDVKRKIVLSTVTATGQEMAKKILPEADAIFLFPLDLGFVVGTAVARINPRLFVTLETEIWPNLLAAMKRRNIPAILVNGRISAKSLKGYRRVAPFLKTVLDSFSALCMQTQTDAERIISLGADPHRVQVCGNLKYDRGELLTDPDGRERALALLGLPAHQPKEGPGRDKVPRIFLAGSTHPGEEEIVLAAYQELRKEVPDLILVIAPRHPERFSEVEQIMALAGFKVVRRSCIREASYPYEAILLDTIGELSNIYAAATIVFVGGSLVPTGGHNPLEPAAWGKPVLFGPHMENFLEIAERLLSGGGAVQVNNEAELAKQARALLENRGLYEQMGGKALAVVRANLGATQAVIKVVEEYLKD